MRRVKTAVVVCALLLAMTGAAYGEVVVEFWHWDYPLLPEVIEAFNEAHAGEIKVEHQLVDFGEYYNKMQVAVIGGVSPDIGIMHTPVVPNWAQRGLLSPIEDDLSAIGVGPENFRPDYVWASTMYDDHQYGLPYGVHPMLLYYNTAMVSEAGLAGPPTDKDSFLQYAQKLTRRVGGEDGTTVWGTRLWPWWFHAASAIVQNGGALLSDDGLTAAFDNTPGTEAMERLVDMVFLYEVSPRPTDPVPEFPAGEMALSIDGVWMLSQFRRLQQTNPMFEFDVASADRLFGDEAAAVWGNGHALVMLDGVDGDKRQAAMQFMDYLSRESALWIDDVPVRDVAVTAGVLDVYPEYDVILQQQIHFLPPQPWAEAVPGPLEHAMHRMFHEDINPQAALEQAANAVNMDIKEFIENMER